MTENRNPISSINSFELSVQLTKIVKQAYFRRSRQLPANIAAIVETLKADLLRFMSNCPIEIVENAITTETLNNEAQLSPSFFFAAVKKAWYHPKTNTHQWDDDHTSRPDTEGDTIGLLDICADFVAREDEKETSNPDTAKPVASLISLPAFNARREYAYLMLRGQIDTATWRHFKDNALLNINRKRIESHYHPIPKDESETNHEVVYEAERLAVISWLRACNTQGRKPSDVLTPLIDEAQYSELRQRV